MKEKRICYHIPNGKVYTKVQSRGLFRITKEFERITKGSSMSRDEIVDFLIKAKSKTYAGKGSESAPSRPNSHDLMYSEGDFTYIDTFLGGERFAGEEALWINETPYWSMNYAGRVTGENFSGDFLKEALKRVPRDLPFRGPECYSEGGYTYTCEVTGGFEWFQGYETISYKGEEIYDCYFHGCTIK